MSNNFFPENHTVYETMWKNMLQLDGPQMTATGRTTRNSIMGRDISVLHCIHTYSEAHSTTLSYPVSNEA